MLRLLNLKFDYLQLFSVKVNAKRHRIVYDCIINDFVCHDRLIVTTVLMVMIGSNRGKSIITDFGCVRIILR